MAGFRVALTATGVESSGFLNMAARIAFTGPRGVVLVAVTGLLGERLFAAGVASAPGVARAAAND